MKHNVYHKAYQNIKSTPAFKQRVFNKLGQSEESKTLKGFHKRRIRIAAAVCVCLCVLTGAIWATAAEAAEYRQAVAFFEENDLPMDGLTRYDIKKVHKDIVMGTFSYDKTAEMFSTISMEMSIETLCESPDKAELEAIWEQWQAETSSVQDSRYEVEGVHDNEGNLTATIITKFDDGQEVWCYTDDEWGYAGWLGGYIETDAGLYIYGTETRAELWSGRVMLISPDGHLVWKKQCANDLGWVQFHYAIAEDSGIVIFGSKDVRDDNTITERYVTVQKYSTTGELEWYKENPVDVYYETRAVVSIGDKYLIKLSGYDDNEKLVAVSDTGAFIEEYTYIIDGKQYVVQDIMACGEKVYLSCMAMNSPQSEFDEAFEALMEEYLEAHYEASGSSEQDEADIPDEYTERLTELFQTQYTAALFVCDTQGVVTNVQLVENARAGDLSAEDGMLTQQIFRIDAVENGPLHVSAFRVSIYGTAFDFRFDTDDQLIEKEEAGLYYDMY